MHSGKIANLTWRQILGNTLNHNWYRGGGGVEMYIHSTVNANSGDRVKKNENLAWAVPGFWIGGGHVLASSRSVVDKGPKSLYNVGGLGGGHGRVAPPLEPPMGKSPSYFVQGKG